MKKTILASFVAVCTLATTVNAQSDSTNFKPSGSANGKIFADWHGTSSQVTPSSGPSTTTYNSAFEITRAYFGYNYNFTSSLSGNVKLDVGNDAGLSVYTAYLKNAGLSWKANKQLTINFGLVDTYQFKLQEDFWGKRYLYNSFQDKYHFGSSADAGAIFLYKINDMFKLDVSILNGDGYKKANTNGQYQFAGGLTITPVKGLFIRGYYDMYTIAKTYDTPIKDSLNNQSTLATFVGYKTDKFSIAAEYNSQSNHNYLNNETLSGESFYGDFWITKKLGIFARYDMLTSNELSGATQNWDAPSDGSIIIAGLECKPAKGVALSLNYQGWTPALSTGAHVNSIYTSLQYAF